MPSLMDPYGLMKMYGQQALWQGLTNLGASMMSAPQGGPTPAHASPWPAIGQGIQGFGQAQSQVFPQALQHSLLMSKIQDAETKRKRQQMMDQMFLGGGGGLMTPTGGAAGQGAAGIPPEAQMRYLAGDMSGAVGAMYPKPIYREFKEGDKFITKRSDDGGRTWEKVSEAERYKPTTTVTTNVYNSPEAKLLADIEAAERAGDTEKAADLRRSYEKKVTPSGESIRMGEMVQTGQQAMGTIINSLMPGGNVDMNAVASMSLALPWTEGRTLDSQMLEAVGLMLRMETGAAQTEDEVANVAKRYRPSMFDSPETAKDKLIRLKERFDKAAAIAGKQTPAGEDLRQKYGLEP